MRMIDKIIRAMQDTGLIDGMSLEDADTLATAVLEGMRKPTIKMMEAGADLNPSTDCTDPYSYAVAIHETTDIYEAMINAALNE